MDSDKRTLVLKSTGAIGDLVIASALVPSLTKLSYDNVGIISKPLTLPLWKGLENTSTYPDESSVPKDAQIVDISNYLSFFPHSRTLPNTLPFEHELQTIPRKAHLCEWMGYSVSKKTGIVPVNASRDNVMVALDGKEVAFGFNTLRKVSRKNNYKPVVVFAPYSTTKNKNLSRTTLETVVKAVSDFAVPCLLEPFSPEQYIDGAVPIGDKDLRKSSAILYAADAYVGVDSGPLHMINGAIQFLEADASGLNVSRRNKVIVALGSSSPEVVAYRDNRVIWTTGGCDISPCGAHGYLPIEGYNAEFKKPFYPSGTERDKSGCVFKNYSQVNTAQCLESISADEIIETIRQVVK